MTASQNDKFMYVGSPGTATTLSSPGYTTGVSTSITVGTTASFPTLTGCIFAIDTAEVIAGEEVQVAGTYTVYSGTVTNGTTISNVTLLYGSAQSYTAGALTRVYIPISSLHDNRLIEGLLTSHDQLDGSMIPSLPLTTPLLTRPRITTSIDDSAGNEVIKTPATASAVNEITVTNAATGNAPVISATGGDSNIDLTLTPKGTGAIKHTLKYDPWVTGLPTPNTVAATGNRSYTLTFNSTDLTGYISEGTRLRTTRTVAAPTQCTDLESGSSQYYNKTTPAGMTFTDDFVVSAWIKLESYPSSGRVAIASRYNGTSGFILDVPSTGQLRLLGYNASSANFSYVQSYQSIPLNKWVHVAAQLDMSTFTATTTTSYTMMDGVDVPATVARGGTNPTALVQAGNLEIGSDNATDFFDGKIAQVAIYSAKVTQANILATISQGLSGSETSLISAYSFNNSINDLNANANNLTAQGSAVATNADSPFGTQASGLISSTLDYGIVQSCTFSTNTTMVVQVPEGDTIPTSGGVSAVSYSGMKTPYGFPAQRLYWRLSTLLRTVQVTTSNATYGAYVAGGYRLIAPIGAWNIGHKAGTVFNSTTDVWFGLSPTALTGLNTTQASAITPYIIRITSGSGTVVSSYYIDGPQTLSSQQTYVMYTYGATTAAGLSGDATVVEIFAENGLL